MRGGGGGRGGGNTLRLYVTFLIKLILTKSVENKADHVSDKIYDSFTQESPKIGKICVISNVLLHTTPCSGLFQTGCVNMVGHCRGMSWNVLEFKKCT